MKTEGFEYWGEVFEEQAVDGRSLLGLSFEDLEDELDVKGSSARKGIWEAIERLKLFQKSESDTVVSDVVVKKEKGFFSTVYWYSALFIFLCVKLCFF